MFVVTNELVVDEEYRDEFESTFPRACGRRCRECRGCCGPACWRRPSQAEGTWRAWSPPPRRLTAPTFTPRHSAQPIPGLLAYRWPATRSGPTPSTPTWEAMTLPRHRPDASPTARCHRRSAASLLERTFPVEPSGLGAGVAPPSRATHPRSTHDNSEFLAAEPASCESESAPPPRGTDEEPRLCTVVDARGLARTDQAGYGEEFPKLTKRPLPPREDV